MARKFAKTQNKAVSREKEVGVGKGIRQASRIEAQWLKERYRFLGD